MAITARKVKHLRRQQKIAERKMRDEMLVRLGAEQKGLLERLGQIWSATCSDCGQRLDPLIPMCWRCTEIRVRQKSQSAHDREKFLKKMGIEKKPDTVAEWCARRGISLMGRTLRPIK